MLASTVWPLRAVQPWPSICDGNFQNNGSNTSDDFNPSRKCHIVLASGTLVFRAQTRKSTERVPIPNLVLSLLVARIVRLLQHQNTTVLFATRVALARLGKCTSQRRTKSFHQTITSAISTNGSPHSSSFANRSSGSKISDARIVLLTNLPPTTLSCYIHAGTREFREIP